jgi:sarcosine oxidase, subunit beta
MMKAYDVVIIGAGSIGLPAAMYLSEKKLKVLVIDSEHAPGQANNKKVIGGVRATHSDYGKITVCRRSIDIFSSWKDQYGDDIGWMSNGYSYPAYNEVDEKKLKDLMHIQLGFGLNIRWVSAVEYNELVPGVNTENLRGSTYSPEDGSCSPLLAGMAFYFRAKSLGAEFRFNEEVTNLVIVQGKVAEVHTNKDKYVCAQFINAAGNNAKDIAKPVGIDVQVNPDNHEAGITEPVARFFGPMVVDMRKRPGSANFYFYQNHEGQVVFCITPEPSIWGVDNRSTSDFLPMCAKRMLEVYPRLRYLKVRRTWRGQYPMTPDGFPIVGRMEEVPNFINAVGMCGQGFMLGPGIGELITRICLDEVTDSDRKILVSFDPYREFTGMEAFK